MPGQCDALIDHCDDKEGFTHQLEHLIRHHTHLFILHYVLAMLYLPLQPICFYYFCDMVYPYRLGYILYSCLLHIYKFYSTNELHIFYLFPFVDSDLVVLSLVKYSSRMFRKKNQNRSFPVLHLQTWQSNKTIKLI